MCLWEESSSWLSYFTILAAPNSNLRCSSSNSISCLGSKSSAAFLPNLMHVFTQDYIPNLESLVQNVDSCRSFCSLSSTKFLIVSRNNDPISWLKSCIFSLHFMIEGNFLKLSVFSYQILCFLSMFQVSHYRLANHISGTQGHFWVLCNWYWCPKGPFCDQTALKLCSRVDLW